MLACPPDRPTTRPHPSTMRTRTMAMGIAYSHGRALRRTRQATLSPRPHLGDGVVRRTTPVPRRAAAWDLAPFRNGKGYLPSSSRRTGPYSRPTPNVRQHWRFAAPSFFGRGCCLLKGIAEGTYNSKHAEAARLYLFWLEAVDLVHKRLSSA